MKKKHKLENGTLLEVGKKYLFDSELIEGCVYIEECVYIDEEGALMSGDEDKDYYSWENGDWQRIKPYQEEKEKDLEGNVFYLREADNKNIEILGWRRERPKDNNIFKYLTLQEAEERGLDVSFFKK